MSSNVCIFCKIIKREIPAKVLYEDEDTISFMDINPASRGHCLVVPKHHCIMFSELSEQSACAIAKATVKVSKMLERAGVANYNILNNNGEQAGQVVKHVHVHLIPKTTPEDGLMGHLAKCQCDVAEEHSKLTQCK